MFQDVEFDLSEELDKVVEVDLHLFIYVLHDIRGTAAPAIHHNPPTVSGPCLGHSKQVCRLKSPCYFLQIAY